MLYSYDDDDIIIIEIFDILFYSSTNTKQK
jgi:hypothetical protein